MTKTLLFLLLLHCVNSWGQCGYQVTLHTNKDYCVGSSLIATSGHALQRIVWYRGGQPVKAVGGGQSLASQPITYPIIAGDGSPLSVFSDIGTDDEGTVYLVGGQFQKIMKWKPGLGNAASTIAGPLSIDCESIFVDKAGDVYALSQDSGVITGDPSLVEEWPSGGADSVITIRKPFGQAYTYGPAEAFVMDCQKNIFIASLWGSLTRWPPGAKNGELLLTRDQFGFDFCNGRIGQRLRADVAGNIYFLAGNYVARWSPSGGPPVLVTPTNCQDDAGTQVTDFWLDAGDTLYTVGFTNQNKTVFIKKQSPVGHTAETLATYPLNQAMYTNPRLAVDVKGNFFVTNLSASGVLEWQRSSQIDSAYTPTDTGMYYAVTTDIQGYSTYSDTIVINAPATGTPSIRITASATSTPVCTPITFKATVSNPGVDPSYQWMVSGVPAGGDSTSYSYNLFADGDQVLCILIAQNGCAGPVKDSSNIIDLHIDPQGAASVTIATPKDTICQGDMVLFTATVMNGSGQPVFEWLLNGDSTGDIGPTYGSSRFSRGDVVTCLITSDDACGLAKSNSIPLNVSTPPAVESGQVYTILHGQQLLLEPVTTGDIETWLWTPATGLSNAGVEKPIADPDVNTLYSLTVTAPGGCSASGTVLVNVYTPLSLPKAFSPNGDGHNDLLYVLGGPVNSVVQEFAVFDRSGLEVFHVHGVAPGDRAQGWDGRFEGKPAPAGTYVYIVAMQPANGPRQTYKGTVVLVR